MKYSHIALIGAGIAAVGIAAYVTGCNPIKSAAEADYEAEQLACVHDNATRAAADTCRAAVKARWAADSAPDVAITETIADGGAQ